MTFDDDHIAFQFQHRTVRQRCSALGISWPPPEEINAFGMQWKRVRYSSITDEQREQMTHVCRGAEYQPQEEQHENA